MLPHILELLYRLLRPLLFLLPPEPAHRFVFILLRFIARFTTRGGVSREKPLFGTTPLKTVGIAAGLLKDPRDLPGILLLKPGFIEIGTLTRYPQEGNPGPRLKRILAQRALWNRMGFPNPGYHRSIAVLKTLPPPSTYIGISLGKGKRTSAEAAQEELLEGIRLFWKYADFFVLNWSSPNTPGLRDLLTPEVIPLLDRSLTQELPVLARFYETPERPILIKLSPDLEEKWGEELLKAIAHSTALSGVVAVNTTVQRGNPLLQALPEGGGISGAPLKKLRNYWIEKALHILPRGKIILACGGIFTAEEARSLLHKGCYGVEVLTALVIEGPGILRSSL